MIASPNPPCRIFATMQQLTINSTCYAGKLKYGIYPIHITGIDGEIVATIEPILEPLSFVARDQVALFRVFVKDLPTHVAAGRPLVLTYYGKLLAIFKPEIKE